MLDLVLAIIFSGLLFIVFTLFKKINIDVFQAIVFNYIIAFTTGMILSPVEINTDEILQQTWFPGTLFLGFLFIVVFNIMGKTAQVNGLTVASVASKMSLIVPVLFGILFFNESIHFKKLLGIFLALTAVYFVSKKDSGQLRFDSLLLPCLLFIGAGTIDTGMNFIQRFYVPQNDTAIFSAFTFLTAFSIGILILSYRIFRKQTSFHFKNILGGIILGIPNFFSMFYMIKALQTKNMESATIFTLLNIGVILFTTILGLLFFQEKLSKQNFAGIIIAIIALFLVR
ncbi:EamA family transporter [Flavobacterium sp. NRK F10]|uniref:EamA family transporter n=1 Tax=Flavobacterium sp. NRK F10 TaxID=2954931 RepID=UPI0020907DDC|nr:EamA family transporter [Flavobacterium sp. NRK F10]MCO6174031.1 EamA family transporter [Flavobacterium sp. NRK F10]